MTYPTREEFDGSRVLVLLFVLLVRIDAVPTQVFATLQPSPLTLPIPILLIMMINSQQLSPILLEWFQNCQLDRENHLNPNHNM